MRDAATGKVEDHCDQRARQRRNGQRRENSHGRAGDKLKCPRDSVRAIFERTDQAIGLDVERRRNIRGGRLP
jgi:hypothetical protein